LESDGGGESGAGVGTLSTKDGGMNWNERHERHPEGTCAVH